MRIEECNIHSMKELYEYVGRNVLFNIRGWEEVGINSVPIKIVNDENGRVDLLFEYIHEGTPIWPNIRMDDFSTEDTHKITRLEFCPSNLSL